MEDQFVPYEFALKLKELGFDEECLADYEIMPNGSDSATVVLKTWSVDENEWKLCSAPLWQQVFDWFRTVKSLYGDVLWQRDMKTWCYKINDFEQDVHSFSESDYSSYEEARQACLEELIKINLNIVK